MRRAFLFAIVLLVLVACSSFDAGDEGTKSGAPDASVVDAGADTAPGADANVSPSACPTGAFLCEPFDVDLDPGKWSHYSKDDIEVHAASGVLVSAVKDFESTDDKGARVTFGIPSDKPIVIELDMKIATPQGNLSSNNFSVLSFGTKYIQIAWYVRPDKLIQVSSAVPGSNTYESLSIDAPHITFDEWVHYVIRADLQPNGSVALSRGDVTLAEGKITPAQSAGQYLSLGVARNNDFYDLHAEYDNVVVYPQ